MSPTPHDNTVSGAEGSARPSGQALVSDQAPTGLAPSGFDPSRGGGATFPTTHAEVVGCTAQGIAAAAVMRMANSIPGDDPLSELLFRNSESVAGAVLRSLGIPHDARAVLGVVQS